MAQQARHLVRQQAAKHGGGAGVAGLAVPRLFGAQLLPQPAQRVLQRLSLAAGHQHPLVGARAAQQVVQRGAHVLPGSRVGSGARPVGS